MITKINEFKSYMINEDFFKPQNKNTDLYFIEYSFGETSDVVSVTITLKDEHTNKLDSMKIALITPKPHLPDGREYVDGKPLDDSGNKIDYVFKNDKITKIYYNIEKMGITHEYRFKQFLLIDSIDDVIRFFEYLIYILDLNFNPDTNFEKIWKRNNKEDIILINNIMKICKNICKKNNEDIYKLIKSLIPNYKII